MFERNTILIAEDTEADVMLLRLAFQKAGIKASLQVVRDGREAISYLSGTDGYEDRKRYPWPDLVVLDLKMPVVDGFEVLAWRKQHPELMLIPVVAFSSSVFTHEIERVLQLGANAYVEKPVGLDNLIETAAALAKFWLGHHRRLTVEKQSKRRVSQF